MAHFALNKSREKGSKFSAQKNIATFVCKTPKKPYKQATYSTSAKVGKKSAIRCKGTKFAPMKTGNDIAFVSLSKTELTRTLSDIPAMELRRLFKPEADCHRAMMQRVAMGKSTCVKRWRDLRCFLIDVISELGRRPSFVHTLDRINNNLRKYGPGLCRWADPTTQNNNRSCSLVVKHPTTGEIWTAAEIAKLHGVHAKTARIWIKEQRPISELLALSVVGPASEPSQVDASTAVLWVSREPTEAELDELDDMYANFAVERLAGRLPPLPSLSNSECKLVLRAEDQLLDGSLQTKLASHEIRDQMPSLSYDEQMAQFGWVTLDVLLSPEGVSRRRVDAEWARVARECPERF